MNITHQHNANTHDFDPFGSIVTIRAEIETDFPAIDRIHIEAFQNHPHSHQTEHLIVRALRNTGGLTLSLVAALDGQVVGHIAFSPALIDGQNLGWFTLGPVAVFPQYQNRGIGSSMIKTGLQTMCDRGANGCLLVGNPNNYKRFGFCHFPLLRVHGIPPEFFMCLPFTYDVPSGLVTHHPAFSTTT